MFNLKWFITLMTLLSLFTVAAFSANEAVVTQQLLASGHNETESSINGILKLIVTANGESASLFYKNLEQFKPPFEQRKSQILEFMVKEWQRGNTNIRFARLLLLCSSTVVSSNKDIFNVRRLMHGLSVSEGKVIASLILSKSNVFKEEALEVAQKLRKIPNMKRTVDAYFGLEVLSSHPDNIEMRERLFRNATRPEGAYALLSAMSSSVLKANILTDDELARLKNSISNFDDRDRRFKLEEYRLTQIYELRETRFALSDSADSKSPNSIQRQSPSPNRQCKAMFLKRQLQLPF